MTAASKLKNGLKLTKKDRKSNLLLPCICKYWFACHYPQLADNISTTVSPMCAISRMIKAQDPEAITVFIGPCLAKKSEVVDQQIEGNADYVLTYSEIRAIMKAKDVELEACPNDNQTASTFGKRFANSGGVTAAVLESLKESDNCIDAKSVVQMVLRNVRKPSFS